MPSVEFKTGTTQLENGVVAIDTEYARPLQDASHLIIENGRGAFVDTGVNSSVPLLLNALREQDLDIGDVDYVFLTHIHLDHAGGAGKLMQALPNARCVVHPRGAAHMIDPAKIVAGTESVYGKQQTQAMYGVIQAIDEHRIDIPDDEAWFNFGGRQLQTIYTEGHARHHYVLNDPTSRGVFTGDSFGVSYRELDTAAGAFIFPTSTPIDFDPAAAHQSYDRILACGTDYVYLTHYSRIEDLPRLADDLHQGIDAYVAMALEHEHAGDRQLALQQAMFDFLSGRLTEHGYKGDRDSMWSVLGLDVGLNAQGLNVWLQRRKKKDSR